MIFHNGISLAFMRDNSGTNTLLSRGGRRSTSRSSTLDPASPTSPPSTISRAPTGLILLPIKHMHLRDIFRTRDSASIEAPLSLIAFHCNLN